MIHLSIDTNNEADHPHFNEEFTLQKPCFQKKQLIASSFKRLKKN